VGTKRPKNPCHALALKEKAVQTCNHDRSSNRFSVQDALTIREEETSGEILTFGHDLKIEEEASKVPNNPDNHQTTVRGDNHQYNSSTAPPRSPIAQYLWILIDLAFPIEVEDEDESTSFNLTIDWGPNGLCSNLTNLDTLREIARNAAPKIEPPIGL